MKRREHFLDFTGRPVGGYLKRDSGRRAAQVHGREVGLDLVHVLQIRAFERLLQNGDQEIFGNRIDVEASDGVERPDLMDQAPCIFRNIVEVVVAVHRASHRSGDRRERLSLTSRCSCSIGPSANDMKGPPKPLIIENNGKQRKQHTQAFYNLNGAGWRLIGDAGSR
nr:MULTISPECIES: hypothetical protein [unclassified Xanthobacter]